MIQNPLIQYVSDGLGKAPLNVEQGVKLVDFLASILADIKKMQKEKSPISQVWYTQSQLAQRLGHKDSSSINRRLNEAKKEVSRLGRSSPETVNKASSIISMMLSTT